MKSKLEIYALSVCFASVVCLVVSFGVLGYAIVKIASPSITMHSHAYTQHQDDEVFRAWRNKLVKDMSDDEITDMRLKSLDRELSKERRSGYQQIIRSFIFVVISSIVFLIHWIIGKRIRNNKV